MKWAWLEPALVLVIHDDQLWQYGGAIGLRDKGLLESALARSRNLAAYGEPDAAALAGAYAFGIARNHPFIDGNKRTAYAVMETFLIRNGYRLSASDEECVLTMLALATGEIDEASFAEWIRTHLAKARRRR